MQVRLDELRPQRHGLLERSQSILRRVARSASMRDDPGGSHVPVYRTRLDQVANLAPSGPL
jgi:hypothetical protein